MAQEKTGSIPVRLSGPALKPISVAWKTRSGTATAGDDFVAAQGTITWAAGERVKAIEVQVLATATEGVFYVDLSDPTSGARLATITASTVTLRYAELSDDLAPQVEAMRAAQWAYIQRATGDAATLAGMPELVTEEGLVKNNQHPETVLGGYLPDGAASSEGISLMMRGVASGFAATGDETYRAYFDKLMDGAVEFFFFGVEPPAAAADWPHNWLVHAGQPFNVRGPIPTNGALDQTGYIGFPVTFTNGVGQLPADKLPDIIYQVATADTQFVWSNVFSDIVIDTGEDVAVDYYVDAYSNKVSGTQKDGSFGQPQEPGSTEPKGRIKLKSNLSGTFLVNFCVKVEGDFIVYGEAYEAWPMWRHLMPAEVSIASDAEHWFFDGFNLMSELVPDAPRYSRARDRMAETWVKTCQLLAIDSTLFKAGASGNYNSWPLSYAYAYGRIDIDDPESNWTAIPPNERIPVARTPDGYVTFSMPDRDPEQGSGEEVRYGFAFEVEPVFLTYTSASKLAADMRSDLPGLIAEVELSAADGSAFTAMVPVPTTTSVQQIGVTSFLAYQDAPGDSDGADLGQWTDVPDPGEWEEPDYPAVPFPGRNMALIGDSITYANTLYNPPISKRYEYQSFGMAGWWNFAQAKGGWRFAMEPGVLPNVNGTRSGFNFGIAGSQVKDWERESWEPIATGGLQMGPMFAYRQVSSKVHCAIVLGGTNDLSGNRKAADIFADLRRYWYEIAAAGKWVFVMTVMPKTTDLLQGYTLAQQDIIRNELLKLNQMCRDHFANNRCRNMFLVDIWDALVGPNGIDPHGCQSDRTNPNGTYTVGNWKPGTPQVIYFPDGLHPGVSGAEVIGDVLHQAFLTAGVPVRDGSRIGALVGGSNLIQNPTFALTTAYPTGGMSKQLGRSTCLGAALTDATHQPPSGASKPFNNLGLGYQHGQVPDDWFLYRATNLDGEAFANFGEYTWSALVGAWPSVRPYMAEPSWTDGMLKSSIVTVGGRRGFRVDFEVPSGHQNEAFVVKTNVPARQNGPWNEYGYASWPQDPPPTNTKYTPGQQLAAEMEVQVLDSRNLFTMRSTLNFLSVNDAAIGNGDASTTGAVISGLFFGQNFWPPDLAPLERFIPHAMTLVAKTPIVIAPPSPNSGERTYAQVNLEVACDASQPGGGRFSAIIFEPKMLAFTGSLT